jgi:Stress responsive A/B Barrel Domain
VYEGWSSMKCVCRLRNSHGSAEDNYEFAVTADFDDADALLIYGSHPDHRQAIAEFAAPIAKTRGGGAVGVAGGAAHRPAG